MKPNYKAFTVIVILIAGYSLWLYQSDIQQKDELLSQTRIFKDELIHCSEIKIQNSKSKLHLMQDNGVWKISKPIQDLASFSAVKAMLKPIQSQHYSKLKTAKKPKYFGLDNVNFKFIAKCGTEKYDLKLSKQLGPSKVHYILAGDEIYVGGSVWADLLKFNLPYLRESYILPKLTKITDIKYKVKSEPSELNIVLNRQKWISKSQPKLKTQQVNKYLKGLENLSAQGFYSNFISKNLMSETGLMSPILKIEIKYQNSYNQKKTWKLSLSQKQNRFFLTSSTRNPIFEISPVDAENMIWSYNDFIMNTEDGDKRDKN